MLNAGVDAGAQKWIPVSGMQRQLFSFRLPAALLRPSSLKTSTLKISELGKKNSDIPLHYMYFSQILFLLVNVW
jgi:hypothetical protein